MNSGAIRGSLTLVCVTGRGVVHGQRFEYFIHIDDFQDLRGRVQLASRPKQRGTFTPLRQSQ